MKLSMPIIRRELGAMPRRRRFYLKRSALVLVGAIVLLFGLAAQRRSPSGAPGLTLFVSLSVTALVTMSLMAAGASCALLMREKEERTLGLVLLSDISCSRFLLGKLFIAVFAIVMALLSLLPLFLLVTTLGGVSAPQIMGTLAVLFGTLLLVACAGLFAGAVSQRETAAHGLLALFFVFMFVAPPLAVSIHWLVHLERPPPSGLLTVISPWVALVDLIYGRRTLYSLLNGGISLLGGLVLFCGACAALPGSVFSREREPLARRVKERLKRRRMLGRCVRPPPIVGNPVAWKDFNFWHGGRALTWLKFALAVILTSALLLYGFYKANTGTIEADDLINALTVMLFWLCAAVVGLGAVSHCGMAFNRERRDGAMEPLLTTVLSDGEIVGGKVLAVLRSLSPWIVGAGIAGAVMLARFGGELGSSEALEVLAAMSAEYFSMLFGYSALALWLSMRMRRNAALPVCFLIFLLWNMIGRNMLLYAFSYRNMFWVVLIDVAVHTGLGIGALILVFAGLRTAAAQAPE